MNAPARILIVDDEPQICLSLQQVLAQDGYEVEAVQSGEAALDRLAAQQFDVVVIDLQLRGISGIDVLTSVQRHSPDTGAIILTAHGSLETAVEALRYGAHDYLFKPCKTADLRTSVQRALAKRRLEQQRQELLAQLEHSLAHSLEGLRASIAQQPPVEQPAPDRQQSLQLGGVQINRAQRVVTIDGRPLELSRTEFDILAYLAGQSPRVISAQELIRQVQGYEVDREEARELARYYVYRIRQKAPAGANSTDIIQTVRGVGYRMGI